MRAAQSDPHDDPTGYPSPATAAPQNGRERRDDAIRTGLAAAHRAAAFVPTTAGDLAPAWANPHGVPPAQLERDLERRNS